MERLERPTKLSQVLQFYADRDLEEHLRAVKKAFPAAKILWIEKGGNPPKPKPARATEQTQLF